MSIAAPAPRLVEGLSGVRGVAVTSDLEDLFQEHHQLIYRTAYSVTGSRADSEDVLQVIFLRLLRRGLPPDLLKNPKGYLYRAAINVSLNTVRRRSPNSGTPCVGLDEIDPRRFAVTNTTLHNLIAWAHGRNCSGDVELTSGGPGWIRSDRFDLEARIPEGFPSYTMIQVRSGSAPKLQPMLQALLVERFKLAVRREMRERPVYVLTATDTPKPTPWKDGDGANIGSIAGQTNASGQLFALLQGRKMSSKLAISRIPRSSAAPISVASAKSIGVSANFAISRAAARIRSGASVSTTLTSAPATSSANDSAPPGASARKYMTSVTTAPVVTSWPANVSRCAATAAWCGRRAQDTRRTGRYPPATVSPPVPILDVLAPPAGGSGQLQPALQMADAAPERQVFQAALDQLAHQGGPGTAERRRAPGEGFILRLGKAQRDCLTHSQTITHA